MKSISGIYRVIEDTCPKAFSHCRFSKARERENIKENGCKQMKKKFTKKRTKTIKNVK